MRHRDHRLMARVGLSSRQPDIRRRRASLTRVDLDHVQFEVILTEKLGPLPTSLRVLAVNEVSHLPM